MDLTRRLAPGGARVVGSQHLRDGPNTQQASTGKNEVYYELTINVREATNATILQVADA